MAGLSGPSFVHLVGSIPLDSTTQVFDVVSRFVGKLLLDVPDGETGERRSFVQWQQKHIPSQVRKPLFGGTPAEGHPPLNLTVDDIQPLRYDDFALASYEIFLKMRSQGLFPEETRFQVSLPSPLTVVRSLVETQYCAQVEPLYEARLLQVLAHIQAGIPAKDLTIQWDVPGEMAMLEIERGKLQESFFVEFFRPYFSPVREGILDRLKKLASAVNPQVEMGYHMCYGNYKQRHWLDPLSLDLPVDLANTLITQVGPMRSVNYVHMPVPKDRKDLDYVLPLQHLQTNSTQLVLGLVHGFDMEGTTERIETAKRATQSSFGVSTECGMTGKQQDYLESVLQISAAVVKRS